MSNNNISHETKAPYVFKNAKEFSAKLAEAIQFVRDSTKHAESLVDKMDILDDKDVDNTMNTLREVTQSVYHIVARCPLFHSGHITLAATAAIGAQAMVSELWSLHNVFQAHKLKLINAQMHVKRSRSTLNFGDGPLEVTDEQRETLIATFACVTIQLTTLEAHVTSAITLGESAIQWNTHISLVNSTFNEGEDSSEEASEDDSDGEDESDIIEPDPESEYHKPNGQWKHDDPDEYFNHYGPNSDGYDEWLKKKDPKKYALRKMMAGE
jgi:hypothetical protein